MDSSAESGARRAAWSRYWASGALHSCPGYGERYGGPIAQFWREVFAALPGRARVLDVATGNGVLPRMLLEQRREPDIACEAVDIAEVRLPWLDAMAPRDRPRVRLHPGVDAARLPFADASFDLVASQYGLEYTDLGRTVPEVLRVVAPGGGVALILHHAQGRPATLAAVEIEHGQWLTRPDGWFDAAAALVEFMARAGTAEGRERLRTDPAANAARDFFNARQNELNGRAREADGADVLFEVRDAAARAFEAAASQGAAAGRASLATLKAEVLAGMERLGDLRDHALDEAAARSLAHELANGLGRPLALGTLREERLGRLYVMGWTMRPAPAA